MWGLGVWLDEGKVTAAVDLRRNGFTWWQSWESSRTELIHHVTQNPFCHAFDAHSGGRRKDDSVALDAFRCVMHLKQADPRGSARDFYKFVGSPPHEFEIKQLVGSAHDGTVVEFTWPGCHHRSTTVEPDEELVRRAALASSSAELEAQARRSVDVPRDDTVLSVDEVVSIISRGVDRWWLRERGKALIAKLGDDPSVDFSLVSVLSSFYEEVHHSANPFSGMMEAPPGVIGLWHRHGAEFRRLDDNRRILAEDLLGDTARLAYRQRRSPLRWTELEEAGVSREEPPPPDDDD